MKRISLIIIAILTLGMGISAPHSWLAYSRADRRPAIQQTPSAQVQSHNEDLPDDLKKLGPAARKIEIGKRLAERKKLREEALTLSKRRDEFIADARRKLPGKQKGFDSAVGEALKSQLARKGIK